MEFALTTPSGDCIRVEGTESDAVAYAARFIPLSPAERSTAVACLARGQEVELSHIRGTVYIEPAN